MTADVSRRAPDAPAGPQSVHRALEVLTIVVDSGPKALSDLARATGLPASTTMRMLRALEHWGFVVRLSDGSYSRGERFVKAQLTPGMPIAEDLVDLSAEIMQRLTRLTQESSYLAVPGPAGTCTFLREEQSPLPIRYVGFDGWAGRTVSMSDSVTGEVLLGHVPAEGYVIRAAVTDPDSVAIGAPVALTDGTIVAALSLAGPSYRLPPERLKQHGEALRAAADELALALDNR